MKHVEFVKNCIAKGVKHKAGTDDRLDVSTADKLIARGYAIPFVAKKKPAKDGD